MAWEPHELTMPAQVREAYRDRMRTPWACRLGFHKWAEHATEDGGRYRSCARCGKDDDGGRPTPSAGMM